MEYPLSITDYRAALRGEIESWLCRTPTDDEVVLFERYVADYIADCINENKKPDLTGVCTAILECRKAEFFECADCGEYYRPDEMNKDWGNEFCIHCKPNYDPDMMPGGHDLRVADEDMVEI